MLRRMKIGARMRLLVAVPLLGLLALGAAGFLFVQRTGDDGDRRGDIEQATRLRSDISPASGSLLRAWAEANAIGVVLASDDIDDADAETRIAQHLEQLDQARADFDRTVRQWSDPSSTAASNPLVLQGGPLGDAFFAVIDDSLLPALDAGDGDEALAAILRLDTLYAQQQQVLTDALQWADTRIAANRSSIDDDTERTLLGLAIGGGAVVLLTIVLMMLVRRSVVRPAVALTAQVRAAAQHSLPALVERLHHYDDETDEITLPAIDVVGRGELAALAAAVNELQSGALGVVADQAASRRALAGNLVHVARRSQALVARALGFISTLEQSERDPKSLDNLFRIDHLTTRMRRTAQALLVLADVEPDRHAAPSIAVGDVVRAALSEVEQFGQVELADVGDARVKGVVAGDVALLLAELLENATSFSPPNSPVTVVGRAVPEGHQLAIFDHGIGFSEQGLAAANARLADAATIERDTSPHLGFKVVARLAARHGIRVTLTGTPGGAGVTAIVQLPTAVLEGFDSPGDHTEPLQVSDDLDLDLDVVDGPTSSEPPVPSSPDAPLSPVLPGAPTLPSSPALPTLPTRVPGAQLPTLGAAAPTDDITAEHRAPAEVRDSLAGLQRGTERGRSESGGES